ncbi:copper amine oxidase N-terminal domain-containing protein [Paenibacillus melissococcoides]|uniref:Copper amine oxidase N-terminal domain-containing protein n=1 Tax=Paenibacillus melissococcoides TaxID=2912268 RepID=A0ABM9GCD9_9BACL|nr:MULTISPECIES: hypothetical protein [Paenibacillus]MEB9895722.1 hypothetical protein [Bacillus cereus]CAH8249482.1 copper amine oxidase N-terminal domain-containing protein [Paenibacillus melissococcoides]CAH8721223.1 copper amine oxidase N-terminal domain-containing protein [Paenibacillus melissococcoides]
MKKKIISIVVACSVALGAFAGIGSALNYEKTQRALEIVLNGNKIPFKDVRPVMYKNTTYVPLRVVSENL